MSHDPRFQWVPLDEEKDKSIGVCGCSCTACSKTKNAEGKVRFAGYDRIPLKTSAFATELSDHQSMVCSPSIPVSQSRRLPTPSRRLTICRDFHSSTGGGVSNPTSLSVS
jgi:hypothetical protein